MQTSKLSRYFISSTIILSVLLCTVTSQEALAKRKKKPKAMKHYVVDTGIGGVQLCDAYTTYQVLGRDKFLKFLETHPQVNTSGIGVNSLDGKQLIVLHLMPGAEQGTVQYIEIKRLTDVHEPKPVMVSPVVFAAITHGDYNLGVAKDNFVKMIGKPTKVKKEDQTETLYYQSELKGEKLEDLEDCQATLYKSEYVFENGTMIAMKFGFEGSAIKKDIPVNSEAAAPSPTEIKTDK